jgi:phosphatidylinositol alpha-1,6-mannosyltransferase
VKVLFLAPELASVGGMQRRDRLLIRAMDAFFRQSRGQLIVYCLNDPSVDELHPDLQHLYVTRVFQFSGNRMLFSLAALRAFIGVNYVFYGLIGFTPLVFAQRIIRPSSKRFLLMHGVDVWERRKGPYLLAARQMNGAISISQYTLDRYRKTYNVPMNQLGFILPNSLGPGVLFDETHVKSNSEDIPAESRPLLLSVARLDSKEQYKGIDTVIQALPTLLKNYPDLIYIVIGDGSDRQRLEDLARKLNVAHAVKFRGFVSAEVLQNEYKNCTLYVMPSAGEGFGLVFIEAMVYGKPIIAAKAGGATEVVHDGENGLLIEYGNVIELSKSIQQLLDSPDLQRKMGQSSLQQVKGKYTFDIFCQNTAEILSQVLKI